MAAGARLPEVPLENNRADRNLREVVVKRKISAGPRTPNGAQTWQIFFTLLTACAKQSVASLPISVTAFRCLRLAGPR